MTPSGRRKLLVTLPVCVKTFPVSSAMLLARKSNPQCSGGKTMPTSSRRLQMQCVMLMLRSSGRASLASLCQACRAEPGFGSPPLGLMQVKWQLCVFVSIDSTCHC